MSNPIRFNQDFNTKQQFNRYENKFKVITR